MDIKSAKIWKILQELRENLPKDTKCLRYKLNLYSPGSYYPPIQIQLLDFRDDKLKKIIEDYGKLWDKYTYCQIEIAGAASINEKATEITFSRCEELIPHKEIEVTSMNIFSMAHEYNVFKNKKPVSLIIRDDFGKYLDFELKSWRDLLRKVAKYAYENRKDLFKLLVKDKTGYIGRMARTKLTEEDKGCYTKIGPYYIYMSYNTQQIIGVCQDIITFTGLRYNDFAVKVDYYPEKKNTIGTNPYK